MEQQTVQCRNGCGFYGNAGTEGYCSVCYKEAIKKKQQPPTGMPASLAPTPNSMATLSLQGESSSTAGAAAGASAGAEGGNETSNSNNNLNTGSPTVLTVPSQIIAKSAQQSDSEMADATPAAAASNNTSVDVQMSSPSTSSSVEAVASTSAVAAAAAAAGAEDSNEGGAGGKKKKNRCFVCKKKLGLTGFSCRCEGLFCPVHRYSDKHDCKFDYKELGAEEIEKSNPVVVASKIQKI